METVLCKDCKHSFIPLSQRLLFGTNPYVYKCKLAFKETHEEPNLVIGSIRRAAEYESCGMARLQGYKDEDRCGPSGKYWAPKNKKDLFKFIKHVGNNGRR